MADNNENDIEYYQKKLEVMEKDLFKSQTQNKKDEATIKKLQDMISIYGKVSFPLTIEQ
jgi:hypothetical protein